MLLSGTYLSERGEEFLLAVGPGLAVQDFEMILDGVGGHI
jgi:hypothetical protein